MRRRLVIGGLALSACGAPVHPAPAPVPAPVLMPRGPAAVPAPPPVLPAPRAACAWARGWARDTVGGRGGQLFRVTTLAASGAGSLAQALATPGPRIVVFEVAGVIDLELSRLRITEPFVTIAGQTAPSPGITLIRGGISVATHDVVIEHLRVRPGTAGQSRGWQPDGISSGSGTTAARGGSTPVAARRTLGTSTAWSQSSALTFEVAH